MVIPRAPYFSSGAGSKILRSVSLVAGSNTADDARSPAWSISTFRRVLYARTYYRNIVTKEPLNKDPFVTNRVIVPGPS